MVRHAFTSALAPSGGPLDLGPARGRSASQIEAAWAEVLLPLGAGIEHLALLHQVHGARVIRVAEGVGPHAPVGEADALLTTRPGVVLAVRVADCVPVLLAIDGGVAAVHAGWRGIVAGVVPAAVVALCRATGAEPRAITAAIGPHAGVGRYETGPEVVEALVASGLPRAVVARPGPNGREHTDLGAAVAAQLAAAGVTEIGRIDRCTISDPAFHSHRRDGDRAGRQAALITLVA